MTILSTLSELEKFLRPSMLKVAEEASSYSDIPNSFKLKGEGPKNGKEALAVLVALDFATPGTRSYHKVEHIRNHIAKMATNYQSEGEWKHVSDYVSNVQPFQLYSVIRFLLSIMNENDLFGNFKILVKQNIRSIKIVKTYQSIYLDQRPVVRPIRKRGYNDKGSSSPLHKRGRNLPSPDKEIEEIIPREPQKYQWYDKKRPPKYDKIFDYIPGEDGKRGPV